MQHSMRIDVELVAMAADADIQRELRAIDEEFAEAEQDGLDCELQAATKRTVDMMTT